MHMPARVSRLTPRRSMRSVLPSVIPIRRAIVRRVAGVRPNSPARIRSTRRVVVGSVPAQLQLSSSRFLSRRSRGPRSGVSHRRRSATPGLCALPAPAPPPADAGVPPDARFPPARPPTSTPAVEPMVVGDGGADAGADPAGADGVPGAGNDAPGAGNGTRGAGNGAPGEGNCAGGEGTGTGRGAGTTPGGAGTPGRLGGVTGNAGSCGRPP